MLGLTPDTTTEPAPPAPGRDEGGAPPETDPEEDGAPAVPPGEERASASAPETGARDAPSSPSGAGIDAPRDTPPSVAAPARLSPPAAYVGWAEPATRFCLLGSMVGTNEQVALDLDNPKAIGVFGYMGSGKSYLLGTLVESALVPISGINSLPAPLAVVIFNYRRHSADRFELSSFAHPNPDRGDRERLERMYQASPRGVDDIHILCLPGQLTLNASPNTGDCRLRNSSSTPPRWAWRIGSS